MRLIDERSNAEAAIDATERLGDCRALLQVLAWLGPTLGLTAPDPGFRHAQRILAGDGELRPSRLSATAPTDRGAMAAFAGDYATVERWLRQDVTMACEIAEPLIELMAHLLARSLDP